MRLPSKYLIAAVIIHGCIGFFEDLIQLIISKAPVPLGNFYNDSLILHYGITLNDNGLAKVMAIFSNLQMIGTIVSLFVILPKMDIYGRKFLAVYFRAGFGLLAAVFMLGGNYFISIECFAIGTFLLGALWPIKSGVTKYYISESSPDNIRGFLTQGIVSIADVLRIGFGFMILPKFLGNDERWHFTLYIAIAIIVIFVIGAIFIPESPKFLWLQGKKSESIKAVEAFHGKDVDIESITHGYELERSLIHTKSNHINLWQIWKDDGLRNSLILVLMTVLVTEMGPLQIYFVYSITLKNKYGFSNSQSVSLELILTIVCLPISYILPFLYEKVGRRPIFLFAVFLSLSTAIFMCFADAVYALNDSNSNSATFILSLIWSLLSQIAINLGLYNFGFILIADLLPAPAKAATTQAMMLTFSILGILFNFLFSFLQPFLGFSYYLPIILIQLFFFFYFYRNLPETRFKAVYQNFEEIQSRVASRRPTLLSKSRASTYNKYGTV